MKKSFKLLTLSILSSIAVCLPMTALIGSCTTSSNETTTSKIVINSQSPIETNTDTSKTPPTLFVNANSNNGSLKYKWLVSKDNGLNWNEIDGATSSSYQLPVNDFRNVRNETTWQYKAEISLKNDESVSTTSEVYKVNIRPSSLIPTTNVVSIDQNLIKNLSTTSDEDLSLSIAASTDSSKSLKYDWYLQKPDSNYVKVQTSNSSTYNINSSLLTNIKETTTWKLYVEVYPEGEESIKQTSNVCLVKITPQKQTTNNNTNLGPISNTPVYARPNASGSKYTKVQYDEERYIGDNSVSILLTSEPNYDYLKNYIKEYLEKNEEDMVSSNITEKYAYVLLSYLGSSLESNDYREGTFTGGTGWLLDYSNDSANSNMVNYYISTNIHVLDASYSITYNAYLNSQTIQITASIPISNESVNKAGIYLSQPQYNNEGPDKNLNVMASDKTKWATDWYQTSVDKTNIGDSLIPIGAYTNTASESLASPYALQLSYRQMIDFKTIEYKYMFPHDKSKADATPSYSTKQASDFAVLKIKESKDKFTKHPSNTQYEEMFKKIEKMFKTETSDEDVAKNSSYIARLNAILSMTTGKSTYDKNKVDELFMFSDYNTNLKNSNRVSLAGFPAVYTNDTHITFNSNTITYGLHTTFNEYESSARQYLEYYYKGKFYYSNYNWPANALLKNVALNPGSSGSMGMTDEYKIVGIYWGGLNRWDYFDGAMTKIYSYTDDKSMVKIWLEYAKKNDSNSKLLQMFNSLSSKGYFN